MVSRFLLLLHTETLKAVSNVSLESGLPTQQTKDAVKYEENFESVVNHGGTLNENGEYDVEMVEGRQFNWCITYIAMALGLYLIHLRKTYRHNLANLFI